MSTHRPPHHWSSSQEKSLGGLSCPPLLPELGLQINRAVSETQKTNNGVTNNGETNNGVTKNGVTKNGVTNNGVTNNGVTKNGVTNNGVTNSLTV